MWILLLFLTISPSCFHSNEVNNQLIGKWISKGDTCRQIIFETNGTFEQKENCRSINLLDGNNECNIYEIDSIINKNTYIVKIYSRNKMCEQRFHILIDFPALVLTPLKSLSGIETHFTMPEVYIYEDLYKDYSNSFSQKSYLYITKNMKSNFIYIAFDQANGENETVSTSGDMVFWVPENGLLKTKAKLDTRYLAFNNFKAIYYDEKGKTEIPILTHKEYLDFKLNLSLSQQKSFLKRKKISINSRVLVALRYNPNRKKVVNKVFGEKIIGQVQPFLFLHSLSNPE